MIICKHLVGLAALAMAGCAGLSAQTPSKLDAGLNLVVPLETLKTITHATGLGGFTAELGYSTQIPNTTIPFRLSASVNNLPGKEVDYVKNALLGIQGAADVISQTGIAKITMITGLSVNAWHWDYQDATIHTRTTMKGAKLGARFGFDYQVNDRLTGSLMLQLVELGTDQQAIRGYNPSWLQAGARYRF